MKTRNVEKRESERKRVEVNESLKRMKVKKLMVYNYLVIKVIL